MHLLFYHCLWKILKPPGVFERDEVTLLPTSSDRKEFVRKLLTPIIETETAKREVIHNLSSEQMITSIRTVLEEINDAYEADENNTVFA